MTEQINESSERKFYKISGIALKPTVSENGNKYTSEDLKNNNGKEVKLFIGDAHNATDKNVIGKVSFSYDEEADLLRYEGRLRNTDDHTDAVEKAMDGLLDASIGGYRTEDEKLMIKHLALVASPGVQGANVESVIAESFQCELEEIKEKNEPIIESEVTKMEENKFDIEKEILAIKESLSNLSESLKEIKESKAETKEEITESESSEEEVKEETKVEEAPKEETEAKVEEESKEEIKEEEAKEEVKVEEPKEEEKEEVAESMAPVEESEVKQEKIQESVTKDVHGRYTLSESFYRKTMNNFK